MEHIEECSECKEKYDFLRKELLDDTVIKELDIKDEPGRKLLKRIRKRIVTIIVASYIYCMQLVS
jgi:hypothetical protein